MGYRKITVDGRDFNYVVGATHFKVQGLGAIPLEGNFKRVSIARRCEACGGDRCGYAGYDLKHEVKPRAVAEAIRRMLKAA